MNWLANLLNKPARGLGGLSPGCREAVRLQSEALDHRLPFRQRFGLRLHLLVCKWCRRYGRQIAFLRTAAKDCAEDDRHNQAGELSSEARARIKRALQTAKK